MLFQEHSNERAAVVGSLALLCLNGKVVTGGVVIVSASVVRHRNIICVHMQMPAPAITWASLPCRTRAVVHM